METYCCLELLQIGGVEGTVDRQAERTARRRATGRTNDSTRTELWEGEVTEERGKPN